MTEYIGPTNWWWRDSPNAPSACQAKGLARTCGKNGEGTVLNDGSIVICVGAGAAWIIAPSCTQVSSTWAGGQYNSTQVGDKCCISEWPALETALTNAGFNPTDWFVPSLSQLQNPGYECKDKWDTFSVTCYWTSRELYATGATRISFDPSRVFSCSFLKTNSACVRAMRCVNY